VSALNQIDLKARASGDVIYIGATQGQKVRAGTSLVQLDTEDARTAIEDAQENLDQAKLDLEKMKGMETPTGNLRGVKEKAQDQLAKAYEDGFNTVSNAFLDLPTVMAGLQDILFSFSFSASQQNIDYYADAAFQYDKNSSKYRTDAYENYQTARSAYDKNFNDYKSTDRFSATGAIESLISETYETIKDVAESVKSTNNLIQFYKDKLTEHGLRAQTLADTHLSSLNTYTGKTNNYLTSLLAAKETIQTDKETLIETDFDIADQETQVKKMEQSLEDTKEKLADYYSYMPFDGIIAEINVKKGDSISSGAAITTLITNQQIAEISLNEVDVAKVKIGQKTNLTFDAVPDLSITGEVLEIDTLGTVTQGVVNYTVKIGFDTQDTRVKSGMSVSATIITDVKQNVLLVPSSALKQQNGSNYVEIMTGNTPQSQSVEIGLSNDTMTEIISGLKEGDNVVTQTITANTTQSQSQSQQSNSFRFPGLGGVGR